jgi:hypothetical protein
MRLPMFLMHYDNRYQKLFCVEKDGDIIIPIFTEINKANSYKNKINDWFKESDDERRIMINIVYESKDALKLLWSIQKVYRGAMYSLDSDYPEVHVYPLADLVLDLGCIKD